MNRVYFDESGNTGQDLWNPADPIFVLASCRFSADAEQQLLTHFNAYKGPELKYSRLRRTEAGRQAVLRFLADPALGSTSVAAFVIHKPFMAVTKYCDVVLEPSMREAGLNFYERGLNLATANLLTTVMPVFLNPRTWTDFLAAFVQVVRERTVVAFADFVRSAELVHSHLHHTSRDMAHWITPVLLLKRDEFFRTLGEHELDPLVPCYYHLADHWGEYLHETFEICADHSNVLIKERAWLLALASQEIAPVKQGFDRRTMTFPLKVASIEAVDSLTQRQIQLADVLAGVLSGALKSANRVIDGTFENQSLKQCIQNGIYLNGVWPNSEIDPQQLGTSEPPLPGQFDLPTYSMMVAQRHPVTQKPQA